MVITANDLKKMGKKALVIAIMKGLVFQKCKKELSNRGESYKIEKLKSLIGKIDPNTFWIDVNLEPSKLLSGAIQSKASYILQKLDSERY